MGRAAYSRGGSVLPVPAREEAEQSEHENDDEDDPEDAHTDPPFDCVHELFPNTAAPNAKEPPGGGGSSAERAGTILQTPRPRSPLTWLGRFTFGAVRRNAVRIPYGRAP